MPPRITQKSCRPRVSHRIVVGTLANALLAQLREPNGVEHHRIMKPSSWNKQLGWSRCWNAQRAEGGQDQNPSWQQTGLDASYHICVSLEVRGEVFLLTSPFIGQLTGLVFSTCAPKRAIKFSQALVCITGSLYLLGEIKVIMKTAEPLVLSSEF